MDGWSASGTAIGRLRSDGVYETVITIDPVCQGATAVGSKCYPRGFDPLAGALYLICESTSNTYSLLEFIRVTGLPTLYEVVATYVPAPPAVAWRVPPMPDGFPGQVESFSVLAGDIADLPNFSQAERIAYNVPEFSAPVAGEELTVPDPLPDPWPRTGRYYLVSAERGGEERVGRQRIAGVLTGRPVAGTPTCP